MDEEGSLLDYEYRICSLGEVYQQLFWKPEYPSERGEFLLRALLLIQKTFKDKKIPTYTMMEMREGIMCHNIIYGIITCITLKFLFLHTHFLLFFQGIKEGEPYTEENLEIFRKISVESMQVLIDEEKSRPFTPKGNLPTHCPIPESIKVPYKSIFIYHDGENCIIPRGVFARKPSGEQIVRYDVDLKKKVPVFITDDKLSSLLQKEIRAKDIFVGVLHTVLTPGMGEDAAAKVDPLMDFGCTVEYNFVHPPLDRLNPNPWHISEKTLQNLISHVDHITPPIVPSTGKCKLGAVDKKIKDLIKRDLAKCNSVVNGNIPTPDGQKQYRAEQLFVIISGDSDYDTDVRSIRRDSGYEVINSDILHLICKTVVLVTKQTASIILTLSLFFPLQYLTIIAGCGNLLERSPCTA
jgi:hypothetical protein